MYDDFCDLITDVALRRISENPEHSKEYPWPSEQPLPEGWTYRKSRMVYDRFGDRARHVRVLYLLSPSKDEAVVFYVFTHAQLDHPIADSFKRVVRDLFG